MIIPKKALILLDRSPVKKIVIKIIKDNIIKKYFLLFLK